MTRISLEGRLICADEAEADTVRAHLPEHIALTRAEPGCLRFEVAATGDPLIWSVSELFATQEAFDAHQARVRASEWGRATVGIRREYEIAEVEGDTSRPRP